MSPESSPKLCECGCGEPAPIATRTSSHWGWVKGQPKRFRKGHAHPHTLTWDRSLWQEEFTGYDTPCWLWKRGRDKNGYGTFKNRNRLSPGHLAHVEAYFRSNGPVPEGLELDHLCHQPPCVNPDHLEAVPHGENLRRGNGAKVSYEIADQIRERRASTGETYAQLATVFGVEKRTIWAIITNRRWVRH